VNHSISELYGMSLAIWDHRVLAATRPKWTHTPLTPARGRYLIYLPQRDGRLSWPRRQSCRIGTFLSVRKSRNGRLIRKTDNVAHLKATMQTSFNAGERTITVIDCCTDISHPGTRSTLHSQQASTDARATLRVLTRVHVVRRTAAAQKAQNSYVLHALQVYVSSCCPNSDEHWSEWLIVKSAVTALRSKSDHMSMT